MPRSITDVHKALAAGGVPDWVHDWVDEQYGLALLVRPRQGLVVHHKDNDPTNNDPDNLELAVQP